MNTTFINTSTGELMLLSKISLPNEYIKTVYGSSDILLTKLDANKKHIWSRNYGSQFKMAGASGISETNDGGFIVSGDLQGCLDERPAAGSNLDIWILKVDSLGILQWSKCLGSDEVDVGMNVLEIPDGGFMVSGVTMVGGGFGEGIAHFDIFLARLDKNGSLLWQKILPGNSWETCGKMIRTRDGNYLVSGGTISTDGTYSNGKGHNDAMLIKLDINGNLLWTKMYGGSQAEKFYDVTEDSQGNLYAVGESNSFDKDVPFVSGLTESENAWVVKLSADGNIIWSRLYGGSQDDRFNAIHCSNSGEIYLGGLTRSSDYGVPNNHYKHVTWLVRLAEATNNIDQIFLGGYNDPYLSILKIDENRSGTIQISSIVGPGNPYVSNFPVGAYYQMWYAELGTGNRITGNIFIDLDSNGVRGPNENIFNDGKLKVLKESTGHSTISTPQNGRFVSYIDTGVHSVEFAFDEVNYRVQPASKAFNFRNYGNKDSFDIRLIPISQRKDLVVDLIPINPARPGFETGYTLIYKNKGTTTFPTAELRFIKSSLLRYISATQPPQIIGDTIVWKLLNINPMDSGKIGIRLSISAPPILVNGDTISSSVSIFPDSADITQENNHIDFKQILTGSFDPNDKLESHGGLISTTEIKSGAYLNYLIRFQNTGTDTAFNIVVLDTLEANLNWESLTMQDASHSYELSITGGRYLKWTFNSILLVDSLTNEPGSHGYIRFKIRPKSDLAIGNVIKNSASIYFDFNLPIKTPIQQTKVSVGCANVNPKFSLVANRTVLTSSNEAVKIVAVSVQNAGLSPRYTFSLFSDFRKTLQAESLSDSINIIASQLEPGDNWIYVRMKASEACFGSLYAYDSINIKLNSITGLVDIDFPGQIIKVFPNPFQQDFMIGGLQPSKKYSIKLMSTDGRILYQYLVQNEKLVRLSNLSIGAGTYIISVSDLLKKKIIGVVSVIKY
ncbi:DUF7619 domain-containing protein [Flavitalea sp.]|nr:T9SS type A sorting domain-containing protein [Flavitalea sp.]